MLTPSRVRLLIADAESAKYLSAHLSRHYDVSTSSDAEEALRVVRTFHPDLVLLDTELPGSEPHEIAERLKQAKPDVCILVLSRTLDPATIFRVSKLADDLLMKPVQFTELDARIARLIPRTPSTPPQVTLNRNTDLSLLYGSSPAMEEIRNTIEQVADTTATVLIRGESGTGKEVTARMVYYQSSRRDKPFVKVNCAAIPHELLESELFGYEPGAFTGANRQKLGKFEQANYGTIFLDEISEMHPALQAKLLHVLQDGNFSRLGGKREVNVDVRVIAATNKQLEQAVADGQFREDLFYRLNVITIQIPPLRERREEIPVLAVFFHHKYSGVYGKNPPPFSDVALQRMMEYQWPGNIRELENMVKRYVIVGNEAQIIRELSSPRHSQSAARMAQAGNGQSTATASRTNREMPLDEDMPSLLEIGRRAALKAEYEVIDRVLQQTKWNRRQAAKMLKVSYKAFLNKLKAMEEEKESPA